MHSEQPAEGSDRGDSMGLQLWVDLPKHLKMCEPRYRDLRTSEIPNVHLDDGKVLVKVISGKVGDVDSVKDLSYTPVWVDQHGTVLYKPGGDVVSIQVPESQDTSARLLLIAGQILDQPIVQHGPFVSTNADGIRQAFEDFYEGKNGFERAKGWQSDNTKRRLMFNLVLQHLSFITPFKLARIIRFLTDLEPLKLSLEIKWVARPDTCAAAGLVPELY
ncbi:pirin (iron-binding nuclear) [Fusarium coicis]|nr:pirin (iron-binding nuclear) [Fusarium coicis]